MDRQYRHVVVRSLEKMVSQMQHHDTGVPFKPQKLFLTSIPAAVAGSDVIHWIGNHVHTDDATEASHVANLLCSYGYIYPLADYKSHYVKDDPTVLYRFQAPYFWLSKVSKPDAMDYAIYLVKRTMRGRQKYGLEEYEQAALDKLQKMLCDKWEFIYMQAEEQVRLGKERKKGDRLVIDAQERAFWRIHRPPPGRPCRVEEGMARNVTLAQTTSRLAARAKRNLAVSKMVESPQHSTVSPEVWSSSVAPGSSSNPVAINKGMISKALDNLIMFHSHNFSYDWFLDQTDACNYWLVSEADGWPGDDDSGFATVKQVRLWGTNFDALLRDCFGRRCLEQFLEKEFSAENLRFWSAVNEHKFGPVSCMPSRAGDIFQEFLASGAPSEINIDSRTMAATERELKKPARFTFEEAQEHIYALMKKDSYARFLRSEDYGVALRAALDHQAVVVAQGKARKGFWGATTRSRNQRRRSLEESVSEIEKPSGSQQQAHSTTDLHETATGPKSPLRCNAVAPWEDEDGPVRVEAT